jgi:hypothetical protein
VKSEEICSLEEERPLKELLSEFATDGLRRGNGLGGGGGSSVALRLCRGDDIGCEGTGFGPGKGRIKSLELDRRNSTGGEDMVDVPAVPPPAFIDNSFGFKIVETAVLYNGGVGGRFSRLEMEASVTD